MQFWPPDDKHMFSKHVEAWNKTYCKTNILCIKLVNYWDKQKNVFWRWLDLRLSASESVQIEGVWAKVAKYFYVSVKA